MTLTSSDKGLSQHSARVRTWFRAIAIAEAFSWARLLVGMLFKYVLSDNEIGVQIFGPIHGGVFIAYVVMCVLAWRTFRWRPLTTVLALAASIPPFCTVLFEVWADRNGRLRLPH